MLNDSGTTTTSLINDENQIDQQTSCTGKEFADAIRQGQKKDWDGCVISERVLLKGATVDDYLEVRGAIFTQEVDFSQARFNRGLDLTGCRFKQKLLLSDACVEGPLILNRVVIGDEAEKLPEVPVSQLIVARMKERRAALKKAGGQEKEQTPAQVAVAVAQGALLSTAAKKQSGKIPTLGEFNNLRVAGCLSLMGATVYGRLACNHSKIENDLRIDELRVYGDLRLRHTSLGELVTNWKQLAGDGEEDSNVKPCWIDGELDLTSATITGDMRLIGIIVGERLSLQGAEIGGNLLCRASSQLQTQVFGSFTLQAAHIKDEVDLSGLRQYGSILNMQGAEIGGSLYLRALDDPKKRARCLIAGDIWLLGATVGGNLELGGTYIGGNLIMNNASVGRDLLLVIEKSFRTRIDGDVYLKGAHVHGAAEFKGVNLRKDLSLDGASIDRGLVIAPDLNEEANWKVIRSEVRGNLSAEPATIGKRVVLMGLTVGAKDGAKKAHAGTKERGVNFSGAQINGEFLFYSEKVIREIIKDKTNAFQPARISEAEEKKVTAPAKPALTTIYGDLRLARAQVLGGIVLDGATIKGNLDLRDATVRAHINCQSLKLNSETEVERVSVHRADLETLDMIGDMDLTGLSIIRSENDQSSGDLILRNAKVLGQLKLHPSHEELKSAAVSGVGNQFTSISGNLHLDAAQISYAIISDDNLVEESQPDQSSTDKAGQQETATRVGLERGSIGRLEIVQGLPHAMNLSNLKVDSWDLPLSPLPPAPSSYVTMLENSRPFKKSNFLAIEQHLRNTGDDERADKVHVLMRQKDRDKNRKVWRFWRRAFDRFLEYTIEYGTTSKRVAFVMLYWFAFSAGVFSNRELVEHEVSTVSWTQPPALKSSPPVRHPVDWGLDESTLYALRLHVPIISLGVKEDVQPSGTFWKAYAMTSVAASWVMWPLLIASASGFIRRRN